MSSCVPQSRVPWGWHLPPEECGCGSLPDWDFSDCDLQPAEDELRDAVITSLYMHAKDRERTPAGGWWGAEFMAQGAGSRLWTLEQSSVNDSYVVRAERYAREALEWLRDIGAIGGLRVFGDIVNGEPVISIELCSRSGDVVYSDRFERLWNG